MNCPRCGSWCAQSDNYCRRCGDKLQMVLPAVPAPRSLAVMPVSLPPAVFKGVAALVAGKALEWAVRRAARELSGGAGALLKQLAARPAPAKATPPAAGLPALPVAGMVITEMVVAWRLVRHPDGDSGPNPPARR